MKFCFFLLSLIFLSHHTQTYGQIAFHDAIALDEANQKKDYPKFLQILANQYKGKSPIISIDELKTEFAKQKEIKDVLTTIAGIITIHIARIKNIESDIKGKIINIENLKNSKDSELSTFKMKDVIILKMMSIYLKELDTLKSWQGYKLSTCKFFIKDEMKILINDSTSFVNNKDDLRGRAINYVNDKIFASPITSVDDAINKLDDVLNGIDSIDKNINAISNEIKDLEKEMKSINELIDKLEFANRNGVTIINPSIQFIIPQKQVASTAKIFSDSPNSKQANILNALTPTTQAIDAFAQFLSKRIKEELTIAFFDKFKLELDKIIEIKSLLPNTYTLLNGRDIFKIPSMGQAWTSAFESDMRDMLKNFEKMVNNHSKYENLRDDEAFQLTVMTARSFEMLTQNIHPAKIFEFLDSQYGFDGSRTKEYHKVISLVQLISKNVRQVQQKDEKENEKVWVELEDLAKLDKLDKLDTKGKRRTFFVELLMYQKPELFASANSPSLSKVLTDIDNFYYSLQQMMISIKKVEMQINRIKNIVEGTDVKKEDILKDVTLYFQLTQNIIEEGFKIKHFGNPLGVHEDEDYKQFASINKVVSTLLEAIQSRNYGQALNNLLQLFQIKTIEVSMDGNLKVYEKLKNDIRMLNNTNNSNLNLIYSAIYSKMTSSTEEWAKLFKGTELFKELGELNNTNQSYSAIYSKMTSSSDKWAELFKKTALFKKLENLNNTNQSYSDIYSKITSSTEEWATLFKGTALFKELEKLNNTSNLNQSYSDIYSKITSSTEEWAKLFKETALFKELEKLNNTNNPNLSYSAIYSKVTSSNEDWAKLFKETELFKKLDKFKASSETQTKSEIIKSIAEEIFKNNQSFKKIMEKMTFYGTFISDILNADSTAKIKDIIERYADPVGSYKSKRLSYWSIDLNAYPGLQFGLERSTSEQFKNKTSPIFGVTAPIGFAFSKSCRKDGDMNERQRAAWSLFFPIVDIGAALSYRFQESDVGDTTTIADGLPENISLKQIFSPGVYFIWNFPKAPISMKLGAQFMPLLREINAKGNVLRESDSLFFGATFAVDIPVFNLFKKTEKKNLSEPTKIF